MNTPPNKPMNFLLTGGLGLIGHNVAMRLENLGVINV
jgi:nucleoside-diphosphate-sugar epimerase